MYSGTGDPAISVNGTLIQLPEPTIKSLERPIDETVQFTNLNGTIISGTKKYRYHAEFDFGHIEDSSLIEEIIGLFSSKARFTFIPHSDNPFINYKCLIKEMRPDPMDGKINFDTLAIVLLGVDQLYTLTSREKAYSGLWPTRLAVF